MQNYQREFLQFVIDTGVLRFGEFKLKSGRTSPYFFNAGEFATGAAIAALGRYYAATLVNHLNDTEFMLFGPAYKGIPLATATVVALCDDYQRDVRFAFNRKEAKDHGEGGSLVGAALNGKVIIIDDVITAGISVGESIDMIRAHGAEATAVVIALDRRERARNSSHSAANEVTARYNIPVYAIANVNDLIHYLSENAAYTNEVANMKRYRNTYGV